MTNRNVNPAFQVDQPIEEKDEVQNISEEIHKKNSKTKTEKTTLKKIKGKSNNKSKDIDSKNIERKFLNALQSLPVGVLSEAVTTEDGVHGLMICTPVTNNTYAQLKKSVEANIRKNKIDIAAQSLLNRIKRKALIEINNL